MLGGTGEDGVHGDHGKGRIRSALWQPISLAVLQLLFHQSHSGFPFTNLPALWPCGTAAAKGAVWTISGNCPVNMLEFLKDENGRNLQINK